MFKNLVLLVMLSAAKHLDPLMTDEILRGVYPELCEGLRMTTWGGNFLNTL